MSSYATMSWVSVNHIFCHFSFSESIAIDSNLLAFDAMKEMQKNVNKWVMVTPVVENDQVVGLLRMHDIIQAGIS